MPRRVLVLLPISLALLCLVAALGWPRGAPPVEAQGGDGLTLLAGDQAGEALYAIDAASGALAPMLTVSSSQNDGIMAIDSIPGTRDILVSVTRHAFYDPSYVLRVNLDTGAARTVVTDLDGAAGIAVRPNGSSALIVEFQGLVTQGFNIREYNVQTGEVTLFKNMPQGHYQPWDLLFTPSGRLFMAAGNGDECSLFELDPVTGAMLHRWPVVCNLSLGSAKYLAYDATANDIVIGTWGEAYISRFNPQTDNAVRLWLHLPNNLEGLAVDGQGNVYGSVFGGRAGYGRGVLKITPNQTLSWLLPPGPWDARQLNLTEWMALGLVSGPRPHTLKPMVPFTPTPIADTPTPTPLVRNTPTPTPTQRPGQVDVTVTPAAGQVGYFSAIHGNRLGAESVFAGLLGGQDTYHGIVQFDLPSLPPQARIVDARVTLTGKSDAQLDRTQPDVWGAYVLPERYNSLIATATYTDVHAASTVASLASDLKPGQLGPNVENTLRFSDLTFDLVDSRQRASGKLTLRLDLFTGSFTTNTLFSWYSGTTPAEASKAPVLHISYTLPVTTTATATDAPTATATPTLTPTPSPTPGEATATPTPTTTQTATPTPSATGSPTITASSSPTATATSNPTATQVTSTLTPTATSTVSAPSVTFDKPYYVGVDDLARVSVFDPTVTQAPIYARASSSGSFGSVVLTLWPSPTTPGLFVSDETLSFCLPDACTSSGTNPTAHLRVVPPSTDLTVQYPATNPTTTGQAQWLETAPPTATVTATLTPSPSPTPDASRTATPTATLTPTSSPTGSEGSQTPTPTTAPSVSPTVTASATLTPSPSPTRGEGNRTPTATPTATVTSTPTATGSIPPQPYRMYLPLLSR